MSNDSTISNSRLLYCRNYVTYFIWNALCKRFIDIYISPTTASINIIPQKIKQKKNINEGKKKERRFAVFDENWLKQKALRWNGSLFITDFSILVAVVFRLYFYAHRTPAIIIILVSEIIKKKEKKKEK